MIINSDLPHRVKLNQAIEKAETQAQFEANLPEGIQLIEPPSQIRDCVMYILGDDGRGLGNRIYEMFERVKDGCQQPGDLVAYADIHGDLRHLGILVKDEMVMSKWGIGGPVLRHKIDYVPSRYGELVEFLRMPETVKKYLPVLPLFHEDQQ